MSFVHICKAPLSSGAGQGEGQINFILCKLVQRSALECCDRRRFQIYQRPFSACFETTFVDRGKNCQPCGIRNQPAVPQDGRIEKAVVIGAGTTISLRVRCPGPDSPV